MTGELDLSADLEIRALLEKAAEQGAPVTVVDLSGVTFIDAHTIGLIAAAWMSARKRSRVLGVVGLRGVVADMFRMLGMEALVLTAAEVHDGEGEVGGQR